MKTTLNKFSLQLLILLFGFLAISCSKDKEEEEVVPDTTNQLEYNGKMYSFKAGLIEDYGKGSYYSSTATHHNHDYTIIDGAFTKGSNNAYTPASASTSILVYSELFSAGTTGFNEGTFNYIDGTTDEQLSTADLEKKYKDKAFFNVAFVVIDANNNKTFEMSDTILGVTGGTIKVSGSTNNPKLEYSFTLTDGKTLKGIYTNNFTYSDQSQ